RFYVGVEGVVCGYIGKGGRGRCVERPAHRQHHYFAYLGTQDGAVGPEVEAGAWLAGAAAIVARYNSVLHCGFNVAVGPVRRRHIPECGRGRVIQSPVPGKHNHLCELSTCRQVERPERAISITRYCPMAVQIPNSLIEVVCGVYVCEGDGTRCCCYCCCVAGTDICRHVRIRWRIGWRM